MGVKGDGLTIELLGGFRVAVGGRRVDQGAWRLRKARSLVKLLALVPERSIHREVAMEALWPDRSPAAAGNNLRQALFVARRAIDSCGGDGAAAVKLSRDVLLLGSAWIDVEAFEQSAADARERGDGEALHDAVALYGGELLPEDRFEQWTTARREALRELHLALLDDLAALAEREGDLAAAITVRQRAVVEEPLHEFAHRELMRLYAVTGRRQRALAQYHLLRSMLHREVADEPDEATRSLYQDILARRLAPLLVKDQAEIREPPSASRAVTRHPTPGGQPNNLPLQLTSFIGRERELTEVGGLLKRGRLVTLAGPGGCGKSRLALETAARCLREYPDGAWLVELAGLSDPQLVAQAAASVLGARGRSSRLSEEAIAAYVGDRSLLLVLDNCEHLLLACAQLAERLLTACPNLTILATSREPLRVRGEIDWRVSSLSLPRPEGEGDTEELEQSEAVRLFCERAAAVAANFVLDETNAHAVAEVCRRLDGIPLAVELAAARMRVLTPAQLAERLRDSLGVLAAGSRTALTRQQTLTATIDWSHDLLDGAERTLFRRLAVFMGGWTLSAAEQVCGGGGLAEDGVLDVLGRLVDKSLVTVEEEGSAVRYRMLDTIRRYAAARLDESGEQARLEARHRVRFDSFVADAEPKLVALDPGPAVHDLEVAHDDLRSALRSGLRDQPDAALRIATALWRFWLVRGYRAEGARWLEAALEAAPTRTPLRARALLGHSVLLLRTTAVEAAQAAAEESLGISREGADLRGEAEALQQLGVVNWLCSRGADADAWLAASGEVADAFGSAAIVASIQHTIGVVAASRGDYSRAVTLLDKSLEILRGLPAEAEPLFLPIALGDVLIREKGTANPRQYFEETFFPARRVAPDRAVGFVLVDLATTARNAGNFETARPLHEESSALFRRLGDRVGIAQALCQLANLMGGQGQLKRCAS